MNNGVLVLGSSIAGLQAALDLADSGIPVHLVEKSPFLRANLPAGTAEHVLNARLLEVLHHPHITVWTQTEPVTVQPTQDLMYIKLRQQPRYVDLSRCTACGECIKSCPVTIKPLEETAQSRNAIYLDGQPGCCVVDKPGKSPCASACPGGIHVQGYVALIAQGRYQEAYDLIHQAIPFPSVCGRVCNHYCEAECTRSGIDQPVNIMALKRFVTEWAYARNDEAQKPQKKSSSKIKFTGKKVAIIGAGPAGLSAGRELVWLGHGVTIFDALPAAGGMMRVGIPPHRLPSDRLDWEIQQILDEGVELQLNTWVDDIPALLEGDYDAVLIATGAHKAKKLPIRNSNHPDNWLSLDVLRRVRMDQKVPIQGKKTIILGGGNVALDTARTILRLGAREVRMVCLEPRGEMPGFNWEIEVAEEEGVKIYPGRTFKEIVLEGDRIIGVQCIEVDFRGFEKGRPDFDELSGTEHVLPADIVIWAIGQEPNFSFLPHNGRIDTRFPLGIRSDENMMTTLPGVFVAGDVHRGMTFFVIDAIGEGKKAAFHIDDYLRGESSYPSLKKKSKVELSQEQIEHRITYDGVSSRGRAPIPSIPIESRDHNFREVDLTLTEEAARNESQRCLSCGVCSECLSCVQVCQAGAIDHDETDKLEDLEIYTIILAEDPEKYPILISPVEVPFYSLPSDDPLLGSAAAAVVLRDLLPYCRPLPRSPGPVLDQADSRLGVFVCSCWGGMDEAIDSGDIVTSAAGWSEVAFTLLVDSACSQDFPKILRQAIQSHSLNQVIIAACSCCNFDQVCYSCNYQRIRCKENLGIFSSSEGKWSSMNHIASRARLEFVNIREHCSWVHPNDCNTATKKAKDLIAAAVSRARTAPAKLAGPRPLERSVILIGKGKALTACKRALKWLGITVDYIPDIPTLIQRSRGLFQVNMEGVLSKASALVLVPQDQQEAEALSAIFGRERRRPHEQKEWGGITTTRPGIFTVDAVGNPEILGTAAAARVLAWLRRTESQPPIAAMVDPNRCRACKTCIDVCEYCAPELLEINGRYTSWIDPAICTGCGTCAAHCPSGAIAAGCSTDSQVEAMLDTFLAQKELH